MTSRSSAKYERTDINDNEKQQTRVRISAARNYIRQIKSVEILTKEWITLVDNIEQLSRLSQMETHIPDTKVVDNQEGRVEGEGTLWDQSAHEETIRVLVEEAKVNLCLRMMNEYKKWDYNPDEKSTKITEALRRFDCDEAQLERSGQTFEDCLGVLLVRALAHVETLQLTDIPLILEHVTLVMNYVDDYGNSKTFSPKSQEKICIYYYASVLKFTEDLNASEILGRIKELDLLLLVNKYLSVNFVPLETLVEVVLGYSALCDNEDFQSNWESFFPTEEHIDYFLELDKVAQKMLAHYEERKSDIRPLLDFLLKLARQKQ